MRPSALLALLLAALAIAITGVAAAAAPATNTPAAAPPKAGEPLTTASGIAMVFIPAGEFVMGSASGADDAKPPHTVRLSAFYMDVCEVTQAAFVALLGINPSKADGDDRPVEQLRWSQAAKYCNARSLKEGLQPCYTPKTWVCNFAATGYRLPTEAEWEYACRAGSTTRYAFGDAPQALSGHAWFAENARDTTHPVGGKPANAWGLHDMHGNVMEWCQDFYDPGSYAQSPTNDPTGPASGKQRVLRGGGFRSPAPACASAARAKDVPDYTDICAGYPDYGFRCVRRAFTPTNSANPATP